VCCGPGFTQKISAKAVGEEILLKAITAAFYTVLDNAGIEDTSKMMEGKGVGVVAGACVDLIAAGVIDPVLV
jgi:hypothetical protein